MRIWECRVLIHLGSQCRLTDTEDTYHRDPVVYQESTEIHLPVVQTDKNKTANNQHQQYAPEGPNHNIQPNTQPIPASQPLIWIEVSPGGPTQQPRVGPIPLEYDIGGDTRLCGFDNCSYQMRREDRNDNDFIKSHLLSHHGIKVTCKAPIPCRHRNCTRNRAIKDISVWWQHVREHHWTWTRWRCSACGHSFKYRKACRSHIVDDHSS